MTTHHQHIDIGIPDSPDYHGVTLITSPYFLRMVLHAPIPPASMEGEFPDIHITRPDPTDPHTPKHCWEIRVFSSDAAGDPALLIRILDDPHCEIPHGPQSPRPRISVTHHPSIPCIPSPNP